MKTIFRIIVFLFLANNINAQIVNIPDVNFKAKLLSATSTNYVALNNAISIKIDINNDGEIQETEALLVTELNVTNSNIADLTGIGSFLNLVNLNCSYNQLTSISVSNLTNLYYLTCSYNQLTSLNILNTPNLDILDCRNNQLTTIDFSTSTSFLHVICSNNLITGFIVNNTITIGEFDCDNNQISYFDLSKIRLPGVIGSYASNPITTINTKNNFVESGSLISLLLNASNLQFICADENEVVDLNQQLIDFGYNNVVVNSYCSFTPGGNYNTITGTTTFDADNNGCDVADLPKPNIKININDGTNQGATFTNNSGDYNFYIQTGSFTLTPNIENPSWFTFSPATATIPFADNNSNVVTQDYCISPNGIHNDLEVVIAPITPARPGFDATYQIVYKNKGNQTLSGNVNLTFDDNKTDFVSAIPNPDNLAVNALSWNYTNLLPFESRTINVTLNVNAPTDTPPVNIDDQLDFLVAINPIVNDEIPLDNNFNYNQIVVGSFDPNNIECLEGEVVAPSYIGQYLHYAVNFENTGNFPAENIVVKIIIDTTKYDMSSLQMLNVSHNSYTRITGNIVEVIFQQINLDSGGHGNLLFKIRTNSNLVEGNSVAKRADIFFDYNAPIDTGLVNTTFEVLSNSVFELDDSISIYPNPTSGNVNINVNDNINSNNTIKSVELYDVQGRLLQTQLLDEVQTTIDISEKSTGIYFLKITSDKGSKVEKLIKE